ncbi:MAG: hypothetical protein LBU32_00490 [Clostridiales bacterium]|nr:hypothetical protein [Clostridiales bacterium]
MRIRHRSQPCFILVLALSLLTACGGNDNGGTDSTGGNSTTPPASQGGNDTTPSNNGGATEEWPDNEYTQQVPKPPFTYTGNVEVMSTFMAEFSDLTIEGALSYEEELIAYGFSVDEALSTRGNNNAKIHLENSAGLDC